jgi:hypothetical protein
MYVEFVKKFGMKEKDWVIGDLFVPRVHQWPQVRIEEFMDGSHVEPASCLV